jgi:hypothetical protein
MTRLGPSAPPIPSVNESSWSSTEPRLHAVQRRLPFQRAWAPPSAEIESRSPQIKRRK